MDCASAMTEQPAAPVRSTPATSTASRSSAGSAPRPSGAICPAATGSSPCAWWSTDHPSAAAPSAPSTSSTWPAGPSGPSAPPPRWRPTTACGWRVRCGDASSPPARAGKPLRGRGQPAGPGQPAAGGLRVRTGPRLPSPRRQLARRAGSATSSSVSPWACITLTAGSRCRAASTCAGPRRLLPALADGEQAAHQRAHHVVAERVGPHGGHGEPVGVPVPVQVQQRADRGGALPLPAEGGEVVLAEQVLRPRRSSRRGRADVASEHVAALQRVDDARRGRRPGRHSAARPRRTARRSRAAPRLMRRMRTSGSEHAVEPATQGVGRRLVAASGRGRARARARGRRGPPARGRARRCRCARRRSASCRCVRSTVSSACSRSP